jgi:predicted molibdopterin-dependent oxidoreductase YjgC
LAELIEIVVDGETVKVEEGTILACALHNLGVGAPRCSVSGSPRGPLCGMGVCFECRVTVDGRAHQRSCMVRCRPGMEVRTHA